MRKNIIIHRECIVSAITSLHVLHPYDIVSLFSGCKGRGGASRVQYRGIQQHKFRARFEVISLIRRLNSDYSH